MRIRTQSLAGELQISAWLCCLEHPQVSPATVKEMGRQRNGGRCSETLAMFPADAALAPCSPKTLRCVLGPNEVLSQLGWAIWEFINSWEE